MSDRDASMLALGLILGALLVLALMFFTPAIRHCPREGDAYDEFAQTCVRLDTERTRYDSQG